VADQPQSVVWRGDVREGYLDPRQPGKGQDMLAYIPEMHAHPACERALKGGRPTPDPPANSIWCEQCTTADPAAATHRRDPSTPDPRNPAWGRFKRVTAA
jgi:hypothetical protein